MPIFQEGQSFRSGWLWAIVGLIAVTASLLLIKVLLDHSHGDDAHSIVVLGIIVFMSAFVMPMVLLSLRMYTKVFADRIEISIFPFEHRVISASEIAGATVADVSVVRQLAGMRGFESNKGLIAQGDRGVQLVLRNGNRLLIGTQEPQSLNAAICSILPGARDRAGGN